MILGTRKNLESSDDFNSKVTIQVSIDLLPRQTLPILLLVKHLIKAKSQEDGTIYYAPDTRNIKKTSTKHIKLIY